MYAIAILRYRRPLEEVLTVIDAHRAYLAGLKQRGLLLASGPFDPRSGGALLLRVPDEGSAAALDAIRDGDPSSQSPRPRTTRDDARSGRGHGIGWPLLDNLCVNRNVRS